MRMGWIMASLALSVWVAGAIAAEPPTQSDWPQLCGDAGRTAQRDQGIAPPYRARWVWCGPEKTLQNKGANAAWSDDLEPKAPDYAMPARSSMTFANRVTPVVSGGRVYIGDMEGKVYAISLDDGSTLWVGENPGGTCASPAVADGVVVVTSMVGGISGLDATTGKTVWRVDTRKSVTAAPLVVGTTVFCGCHDGNVYAIEPASGKVLWKTHLGAPVVADLCGDDSAVYVGAEDMNFCKLDIKDGQVLAKTRLMGQSFRMLHPVLHEGLLFVQTVQGPCVGSEYVMEGVMKDSPDNATEQQNILRWLKGDTNDGKWPDASPAWKHLHVLRTSDLTEPFVVPNGPADGCGAPCPPPCVDSQGRVLTWFKTAYPTLTKKGSFGTKFSMDISAIDLKTGLRVPIDNGRLSGQTGETDNLFALSVGGPYLYMRQDFRGTKLIDLTTSRAHLIHAAVRTRDGGTWDADVVYVDTGRPPKSSQTSLRGRAAPVIAGDKLLWAESYCVTAVEHRD